MHISLRRFILCLIILASAVSSFGQVATGIYAHGTFDNKGVDTINVGNLNVNFSIPVAGKAGRGMNFRYNLLLNTSIWSPIAVNGSTVWQPSPTFGWSVDTNVVTGYASYVISTEKCKDPNTLQLVPTPWYRLYTYTDPFGIQHRFKSTTDGCAVDSSGDTIFDFTELAADGSGYTMQVSSSTAIQMVTPSGRTFVPPVNQTAGAGTVTDSNGNQISVDGIGRFTDTTGKIALTVAPSGSSSRTFTYTDTNGNPQQVTLNYKTYTVQTKFGCTVGEYGPTSAALVDNITFPDGSAYHFSYEPTPGVSANVTGRLASVTLPQGGQISYSYTGGSNGIV